MPNSQSSKNGPGQILERVRRHQSVLLDFARVAAEATDTQRLLDLACQHAVRGTNAPLAKVMRYRSDKRDLLVVAGKGWKSGIVGHARLGADMLSPPGRSYQTRESVISGSLTNDPAYRYASILRDHDVMSVLNAPVAIDGVVWGVLEIDHTAQDAFDDDDQRFLLSLALTLALGIRHRQGQANLEQKAEELGRRLAQADTMMGEQNHRVRNYFQMILSIMGRQAQKAASEQIRAEYEELMDRVSAVGLAHDLLTVANGESSLDAATYLDALCSGLERTLGDELRIERDLEPLQLRPDRAVPLGLVLNELMTNSIKHALQGRPDGFISVSLRVDAGSDEAVLVVRDNGPGMGEQRPGGQGLKLVQALAGQLSGRVNIDSSPSGTAVTMFFPLVA